MSRSSNLPADTTSHISSSSSSTSPLDPSLPFLLFLTVYSRQGGLRSCGSTAAGICLMNVPSTAFSITLRKMFSSMNVARVGVSTLSPSLPPSTLHGIWQTQNGSGLAVTIAHRCPSFHSIRLLHWSQVRFLQGKFACPQKNPRDAGERRSLTHLSVLTCHLRTDSDFSQLSSTFASVFV